MQAPVTDGDEARSAVWRQSLSVGIATGLYAISFGALSVAAGLSVLQTCVLSLLLFTGGSQFAFVGVAGAGGSGIAAVVTAAMLGARNGFYGLQMATVLDVRGLRRLVAAQLTLDESTAVGSAQLVAYPDRPELARLGFWVTGGTIFILWNAMTLVGALAGDALGDPRRYGLDAAAAAAFLALLWPRLKSLDTRAAAAVAALLAVAAVPFATDGVPVLAGAAIAVAVATLVRRTQGQKK